MKRTFKRISIITAILLFAISAWSVTVVYQARSYIETTTLTDLAKAQWRRPGQSAQPISITADALTPFQYNALIKVQDPGFAQHSGMDLTTPGAGVTTLTQGLVKRLFFHQFKPGIAKIKQTLIAVFAVDALISKQDQVTLFINCAYLGTINGRHIYGFEKAAAVYYNKRFAELSEDQYLTLIATLIGPARFNPTEHPAANADRVMRIKQLLTGEYHPLDNGDVYYRGAEVN